MPVRSTLNGGYGQFHRELLATFPDGDQFNESSDLRSLACDLEPSQTLITYRPMALWCEQPV